MTISAVVLTYNDQNIMRPCFESLKWVDEIIVVDHSSIDDTVKIAKEYTSKVFIVSENDFSTRRNLGIKKASGEWVLYVDTDERVLAPLKKEIESVINFTDKSAFAISRKNIIFGQEVSYGPYEHDWMIRLLKKADFETWIGKVHEYAKFKGHLGYTKNSLLHLTHRDLDQFVRKSLDWSHIDARLRLDAKHPKMTKWRFIRIFITEIYEQGIKRKGFFGGTVGVIDSLLQVFFLYISYVRLWQLQQPKSMDEKYKEIDKKLIDNSFEYYPGF